MEASPELLALRQKVEKYLRHGLSRVEAHGERYLVRAGSAAVLVHPFQLAAGTTLVRLLVPALEGVAAAGNEGMFREFSRLNDELLFGKIYWAPKATDDDTVGTIYLEHVLLGEYLDAEELLSALTALALAADRIDDDLQAKYGGERWTDPPGTT